MELRVAGLDIHEDDAGAVQDIAVLRPLHGDYPSPRSLAASTVRIDWVWASCAELPTPPTRIDGCDMSTSQIERSLRSFTLGKAY